MQMKQIPRALHFLIVVSSFDLSTASALKQHSIAADALPPANNAPRSNSHLRVVSNAFLEKETEIHKMHLSKRPPSKLTGESSIHSPHLQMAGVAIFGAIALAIVVWVCWVIEETYDKYSSACQNIDDVDWSFGDFVAYQFGQWMTWTKDSSSSVLLGVSACVFLVGTFAYWLFVPGAGIWHGAWMTFIWMVAPDGGIGETTFTGAACGGFLSLCGLLIFALVLTLVQQAFDDWMKELREGVTTVMEEGHVLIIGLTSQTVHLIGELGKAYHCQGGVTLVVMLGDTARTAMEEMIAGANMELLGSRIVLRPGFPQYVDDLEICSAHSALSIIILANHDRDKEVRDAFVMQALLVLREKGWPQHGRIVAECSLSKNRTLLEQIGGDQTSFVMMERWLAKMSLQVSQQPGLGAIISSAFSFDGSEMYITDIPDRLVGKTLTDIGVYFPKAVVAGSINAANEIKIGHCEDHTLKKGDELIMFCENMEDSGHCTNEPYHAPLPVPEGIRMPPKPKFHSSPEKILIVGWGTYLGALLVEIDKHVCKGTRITIVSPKEENGRASHLERSQRRWQHKFKNISFDHVVGMLGSPTVWDRLPCPVWEFSCVFLLADLGTSDAREADACTIVAAVHLRSLLTEAPRVKGGPPPHIQIVPELKDPRSEHLARICNLTDSLDSAGMPVQVMAALSVQPRLRTLMRDLVGDEGPLKFYIRRLDEYLPENQTLPSHLSFIQAQAIVAVTGGVLVAWSDRDKEMETNKFVMELETQVFHQDRVEPHIEWIFNPHNKTEQRPWSAIDRLAVLVSEAVCEQTPRTARTSLCSELDEAELDESPDPGDAPNRGV